MRAQNILLTAVYGVIIAGFALAAFGGGLI